MAGHLRVIAQLSTICAAISLAVYAQIFKCDDVPDDITRSSLPNGCIRVFSLDGVISSQRMVRTAKSTSRSTITAPTSYVDMASPSVILSKRRFIKSGLYPQRSTAHSISIQSRLLFMYMPTILPSGRSDRIQDRVLERLSMESRHSP